MFDSLMDPELEKLVSSGRIAAEVGEKISALQPEAFCEHKSWGVGRVRSWDLVGDQLEVDFEGRPGHAMKLEFAAKSLSVIPENHILAQRAGNLDELKQLAADDPVEVVLRVLQSFENRVHLDNLEGILMGSVIPEGEYKSWWDATKRKLRKDKSFVVPSRRSEPLELRPAGVSPAEALFSDFQNEHDLKDKAKAAALIVEHIEEFEGAVEKLETVVEEINNALPKALKTHPVRVVELIAVRDEIVTLIPELNAVGRGLTLSDFLQAEQKQLGHILTALPVTRLRLLLAAFPEAFGESWPEEALVLLSRVGGRGVSEITRCLIENKKHEELTAFLKKGVRHRDLSSEVLAWICREREGSGAEIIDDEFPVAIMNSLEKHHLDEENRRANRLHDLLLDDRELMADLVRLMDVNHVRTFARRLLMTPVFEELNRRSLLARIIKIHPEVQELVGGDSEEKKLESLVVSWESLEQRKNDLEELIRKKIPENTKEIAIARSYGDLRENFEFKAAKQMQAVLMRKKSDWAREIEIARGTDFRDADPSKVSIGTVVSLEDCNGGGGVTYTLLGAWDSEPEKNVVAYLSDVGKALLGKEVGEEVGLPGEEEGSGKRTMKIVEIQKYIVD